MHVWFLHQPKSSSLERGKALKVADTEKNPNSEINLLEERKKEKNMFECSFF